MQEFGPQCVLTVQRYIIAGPADTLCSLVFDPKHKGCQPGQRLKRPQGCWHCLRRTALYPDNRDAGLMLGVFVQETHSVSLLCIDIIIVSEARWQTPHYRGMLKPLENITAQIAASALCECFYHEEKAEIAFWKNTLLCPQAWSQMSRLFSFIPNLHICWKSRFYLWWMLCNVTGIISLTERGEDIKWVTQIWPK